MLHSVVTVVIFGIEWFFFDVKIHYQTQPEKRVF